MATRYRDFPQIRGGVHLQKLTREEIGGTPSSDPEAYALRSPIHWVRQIARSGVPCTSGGAARTRSSSTSTTSPASSTGASQPCIRKRP